MYNPHSILRSWLLTALYSATAFTFSCQREQEVVQPVPQQVTSTAVTSQELIATQQAFDASGYASALAIPGADPKLVRHWQPQWKTAFKAEGALYVLLLPKEAGEKFANAKHFLVVNGSAFSLALYILPLGQDADLLETSPAFLRTFTGQLALHQLGTNKGSLRTYKQGQRQADPKSATKGTTPNAATQGTSATNNCVTRTMCHWEGRCFPGYYPSIASTTSIGMDGMCDEPTDQPCGSYGAGYWHLYKTESFEDCNPDDDPPTGPIILIQEGWYKVTSVSSGLVLDVFGGNTAYATPVVQWPDQNSDNQIWYVTPRGTSQSNAVYYTLTPRTSYLYATAQNLPPFDHCLGISDNNNMNSWTSNAGAQAKIWNRTSFIGWIEYNPMAWDIFFAGSYTTYTMRNNYSGKYLTVPGNATNAGVNLTQEVLVGGSGSLNQRFTFTKVDL